MPAAAVIPTLKVYVKVVAVKTLVVGFIEHIQLLDDNFNCQEVFLFSGLKFGGKSIDFRLMVCLIREVFFYVTLNKIWCSKHVYFPRACSFH